MGTIKLLLVASENVADDAGTSEPKTLEDFVVSKDAAPPEKNDVRFSLKQTVEHKSTYSIPTLRNNYFSKVEHNTNEVNKVVFNA